MRMRSVGIALLGFALACSGESDARGPDAGGLSGHGNSGSGGGSGTGSSSSGPVCTDPLPDAGSDECLACALENCCEWSFAAACISATLPGCYQNAIVPMRECFSSGLSASPTSDPWDILDECVKPTLEPYDISSGEGRSWYWLGTEQTDFVRCAAGTEPHDDDAGGPLIEGGACSAACFPGLR